MEIEQLPTIHHALSEAAQETRGEAAMGTYTFRISQEDKESAEQICSQNGASFPAFLRACAKILPRDYKP